MGIFEFSNFNDSRQHIGVLLFCLVFIIYDSWKFSEAGKSDLGSLKISEKRKSVDDCFKPSFWSYNSVLVNLLTNFNCSVCASQSMYIQAISCMTLS